MFVIGCRVMLILRIDDPVTATPIHLGGGVWGVMAVAFFAHTDRLDFLPNGGILYAWDADAFLFMGVQLMGAAVISAWSFLFAAIIFLFFRVTGLFRVSKEEEIEGLDFADGDPAYPMDFNIAGLSGASNRSEADDEFDQ